MRHVGFALLMALLLALAGCDLIGGPVKTGDYPTTLTALPEAELEERTDEFHEKSGGQVCSRLDPFGFASGEGCFAPDEEPDQTLNEETAVALAKQELATYQKYTNVESASALRIKDARPLDEDKIWRVTFRDQVYEGQRVRDTDIFVWLSADGIFRIDQHWYRGIVFPREPISRTKALQRAVGYEISYSDWTGSQTLRVSEENLPPADSVEMSVLPHRVKDELQLRVVWEFELSDSFFRLYIDAARGKVVDTDQLVVF